MAAPAAFFNGCNEGRRYTVHEVISRGIHVHVCLFIPSPQVVGRGSYGVVCAATDNLTGERVAIKRMLNVFANGVPDASRALREIKLLQLLKHQDLVEIKVSIESGVAHCDL